MKKFIIWAYMLCIVFFTSACMFYAPDEVREVTPHYGNSGITSQISVTKVQNYTELKTALYDLISSGKSAETIRFVGYDGNAEEDFDKACNEISNSTALGLYRVYYMSGTVNKIVSYYEVKVSVTYKAGTSDVTGIEAVCSEDMFYSVVHDALKSQKESLMVYVEPEVSDDIYGYMELSMCRDPLNIFYLPTYTVNNISTSEYLGDPEIVGEMIELSFTYLKSSKDISGMRYDVSRRIEDITSSAQADNEIETVYNLVLGLGEEMEYISTRNGSYDVTDWSDEFNSYGALVNKKSTSKGITLAFKALCDKLGIECYAVNGEYMGSRHYWNIVNVDGVYFHIDPSYCMTKGFDGYFLKSSQEFSAEYSWDTQMYPACGTPGDFSYLF